MNKYITYLLTTILAASLIQPTFARSKRVSQLPNGSINRCATCHINAGGGGPRNEFGKLVGSKFLNTSGDVMWGPELASIDADGDGISNGDELQDQFGSWITGEAAPGISSAVSNPGDINSKNLKMVNVHLSAMSPHAGQKLFIRSVDKSNGKEVTREMVESILDEQTIQMGGLIAGHSYWFDLFADHNGNGHYDAPPTDHSWRIDANNIEGEETLEFQHNTNFTDIDWRYLLTINFSSMDPHVGQMLEFAVEDDSTSQEVGRMKINSIPNSAFSATLSGLELNREYQIEMYSDHNGNGLYDDPPTDHAWRIDFTNSSGDVSVDFVHNTEFKDVGWKYQHTLNLLEMSPHVGQMLELRIVRNDNNEEVGRTKINSIPQSNFSISIPDIELDHEYNVDFFTDHNDNGLYDTPPTDHAWRLTFNSHEGNFVQNFTHNTSFTDINWPNVVGVESKTLGGPSNYVLMQNYPNPFNPSTKISFRLKTSGFVTLDVYNILGQRVASIINRELQEGSHSVTFDASDLPSGAYVYRMQSNKFTDTKKMMLLR